MNQLTKRIVAGTMALAVVGSAAPISNYLGIKTAITASAASSINLSILIQGTEKYIEPDDTLTNNTDKTYYVYGQMHSLCFSENENDPLYQAASGQEECHEIKAVLAPNESLTFTESFTAAFMTASLEDKVLTIYVSGAVPKRISELGLSGIEFNELHFEGDITEISGWSLPDMNKPNSDIYFPETVTNVGCDVFSGSTFRYVYFSGNKPSINGLAFRYANLTICYPEGDESWNGVEDGFSAYPGVKWQTYKPASKVKEVPVQNLGSTVTINDSLNMNFFMDIPEDLKDKTKITASVNGKSQDLDPELVDGTTYKVTVGNISAKDAASPIEICAVDKNDPETLLSKKFTTSVKDYLVAVYQSADDTSKKYPASTKAFVTSILNYCDTAEKYFDLDTTTDFELDKIDGFSDSLAEIAQSADDILNKDNIKNAQVTPDAIANADDYRYMGSSLLLKSKLALRSYYKAENGADTSIFNGCKGDIELYYFEIKDISPLLFDVDINGYSVFGYIKQVLSSESTDASLKDVCTALYTYGKLAGEYQMQIKDDDET